MRSLCLRDAIGHRAHINERINWPIEYRIHIGGYCGGGCPLCSGRMVRRSENTKECTICGRLWNEEPGVRVEWSSGEVGCDGYFTHIKCVDYVLAYTPPQFKCNHANCPVGLGHGCHTCTHYQYHTPRDICTTPHECPKQRGVIVQCTERTNLIDIGQANWMPNTEGGE